MEKIYYFLFLVLISTSGLSQISYGKKIVRNLSSSKMHGRGYVKNGDLKAAKYIAKEFKKNKLIALEEYYFQKFDISVNTQPSKLEVIFNDTLKLTPGVDFLINPASPSLKGDFKTILLETRDLLNQNLLFEKLKVSDGKVFLVNTYSTKYLSKSEKNKVSKALNFLSYDSKNLATATFIFSCDKLTWSGSSFESKNVSFTVNKKIDLRKLKTVSINTESVFFNKYTTQNVVGFLEGYSKTDSTIVITAHYDHLGKMGKKTIFPGANDNASGIALLLNLAKHYSIEEQQPKYNMIFIAFGAEEIGLLGSKFYTENPLLPLSKIKFMLNFDLAGTGDDGIKVVNATQFMHQFDKLTELNNKNILLPTVLPRGPACNSDHCYFYREGVPVFYIYTLGGIKAYHDIYDKYGTLPFTSFENYSTLIKLFIKDL
jgi:hypothetical protein